jgi:hypothetical protein
MKKLYLSILAIGIAGTSMAQVKHHLFQEKVSKGTPEAVKPTNNSEMLEKATVVWSNTCNNIADWSLTNTSTGPTLDWGWSNNPDLASQLVTAAPFATFDAATAGDGYLFVNSDAATGNADNNGSRINAEATITVGTAMPAGINVLLRFQHNFRWWQDIRGVRVSGDGGVTFPIDTLFSDATGSLLPSGQNSGNPEVSVVDISSVAMGAAAGDVVVQFYYDDQDFWGWYWVIDDVEIIEQPDNDVQVLGAYFSGASSNGHEWGRTPLNHIDPIGYQVGAEVYNFGSSDQTNVTLDAQYTGASSFTNTPANTVLATLASGATDYPESTETPALSVGVYSGTYVVETDGEQAGSADFADNTYQRNWEITNNIYSLDGIGNHPVGMENLASVGTANFTDGADGLTVCAMYTLQAADDVSGVRAILSSTTTEGGEMFVSIHDTTGWIDNGPISPLFSGAGSYAVTAADVANGYADVLLASPASLSAGSYYMCVELYSNGNSSDIQILDDETVAQPFWASSIYLGQAADPGPYTNGTSVGVRALMGSSWLDLTEIEEINSMELYPNPASENATLSLELNGEAAVNVTVTDLAGKVIQTNNLGSVAGVQEVNINTVSMANGVYIVNVEANGAVSTKKLVVRK